MPWEKVAEGKFTVYQYRDSEGCGCIGFVFLLIILGAATIISGGLSRPAVHVNPVVLLTAGLGIAALLSGLNRIVNQPEDEPRESGGWVIFSLIGAGFLFFIAGATAGVIDAAAVAAYVREHRNEVGLAAVSFVGVTILYFLFQRLMQRLTGEDYNSGIGCLFFFALLIGALILLPALRDPITTALFGRKF